MVAKKLPTEWPATIVRPFDSFEAGYQTVRDYARTGDNLRTRLLIVTNDHASLIDANTGDIATNTADIATNTSDIADNVTDIATNAASIATLATKHISGLVLSNAADAAHDITISAGQAGDPTIPDLINLTSAITKQIDAAWAVGTNQGGLDTGTVAADETYHVHLIERTDTGVEDVLFSLSPSAPTMPTDYDRARRIGSVLTDGSADIIGFTAYETNGGGLHVLLDIPVNDQDATNPGTSAVTVTLSVPTGIKLRPITNISATRTSTTTTFGLVTSLDQTDTAPSSTILNYYCRGNGSINLGHGMNIISDIYTNTSGQVRTRLSASGADLSQRMTTLGWIDSRRRDN